MYTYTLYKGIYLYLKWEHKIRFFFQQKTLSLTKA